MDLCRLKLSGAVFRAKLAQVLYGMNYRYYRADHDVWMRPSFKVDGFKYYEYVICYGDDLLCIINFPLKTIHGINTVFKLKGGKAEPPEIHLGYFLQQIIDDDGTD